MNACKPSKYEINACKLQINIKNEGGFKLTIFTKKPIEEIQEMLEHKRKLL